MEELILGVKKLVFSTTARATSYIFIGNATSSLLAVVFSVLAARFLGPANWGIVAAVTSFIPILVALTDLGVGSALFQYAASKWRTNDDSKAVAAFKTALSFRFISLLFVSLLIVFFARNLSNLIFKIDDPKLIFWALGGLISVSLFDFLILAIQSRREWKRAAVITGSVNLLRVAFLILVYLFGTVSVSSVLFVYILSGLVLILFPYFRLGIAPGLVEGWRKLVVEFARFSLWLTVNKMVGTVASRVDVIILLQFGGAYMAGVYSAANRLVLGVPLLAGSIATVLAARFASLQDKEQIRAFFIKSCLMSWFLALVILIVGILSAPYITLLFGNDYREATGVMQWLFVAIIPLLMSGPAVNVLIYHFKKTEVIAFMAVLQLIIVLVVNYLFIPQLGVFAPVLALGIAQFSTTFITYIFAVYYLYKK